MTFEMWWVLLSIVGIVGLMMYEIYASGLRRGRLDGLEEARKATFAALRAAVEEAATSGERSAAWAVARHALEPRDES